MNMPAYDDDGDDDHHEEYDGDGDIEDVNGQIAQHSQQQQQQQRPPKNLFWAGTEFATQYCGYMEGAIYSGEDAAKQVISYLTQQEYDAILESIL